MSDFIRGFFSKEVADAEAKRMRELIENTRAYQKYHSAKVVVGKPLDTFLGTMSRWDIQLIKDTVICGIGSTYCSDNIVYLVAQVSESKIMLIDLNTGKRKKNSLVEVKKLYSITKREMIRSFGSEEIFNEFRKMA